jgi:type VI secretion system protein ImpC
MKKKQLKDFGVHIQARAEARGSVQRPELSYRILYVSSLVPIPPVDAPRIHPVDKNSFASLLQKLSPALSVDVPNMISAAPPELSIELRFTEMNSFRPEGVIGQVPPLARLITVRSLVKRVKEGGLPLDKFREEMITAGVDSDLTERFHQALAPTAATRPASPPTAPRDEKPVKKDRLDSLLDMVSLTPESEGPPVHRPTLADSFIAAASSADTEGAAGRGVDVGTADELISELDSIVSDQLTAILHHPAYQQLEASWRGLKFLVDRMDFRKNISLGVLPAEKERLAEALLEAIREEGSDGAGESGAPARPCFAVAEYRFGHSVDDLSLLERLAEAAAQLGLPVASGADASFFGKSSMSECASLPLLWQHFEEPQYLRWSKFRDTDASAQLALALPEILLRFPYGGQNPVKQFTYAEPVQGENDHVWGNGALLLALGAAQSVAESSWPTNLSGMNAGGRVEGLPVWQTPSHVALPLSVLIPESKQVELAESGFSVLGCRVNSDSAYVAHAPVLRRHRDSGKDPIESTLAYRLLAARVIRQLERVQRVIPANVAKSELRARLTEWITEALGAGLRWRIARVETESAADDPESLRISLDITSPPELLGGEATITVHIARRMGG